MTKYKGKYRIPSARLKNWDYGSSGYYFVTINTKNRVHYFGKIVLKDELMLPESAVLSATVLGQVAHNSWMEIPAHFPFAKLVEFVVMPDHIHGVLYLGNSKRKDWNPNHFGPQSNNLGSIIRGYKIGVKKYSTINGVEFNWQPRFHDHIIRCERELTNIRRYIVNNPLKWYLAQENKLSSSSLLP